MKVYIAGPISGHDYEERVRAFQEAEDQLKASGYEVINPFKCHNGREQNQTWERNMKECICELVWCDAIYLLIGWKSSKGATIEANLAKDIRLRILTQKNDLDKGKLKQGKIKF